MQYLSSEVPAEAQTAPMCNSILEAALYSGDGKLALEVLQHVCTNRLPRNSRTATAMLRIMVGGPKPLMLCLLPEEHSQLCCNEALRYIYAMDSCDPLDFLLWMHRMIISHHA